MDKTTKDDFTLGGSPDNPGNPPSAGLADSGGGQLLSTSDIIASNLSSLPSRTNVANFGGKFKKTAKQQSELFTGLATESRESPRGRSSSLSEIPKRDDKDNRTRTLSTKKGKE